MKKIIVITIFFHSAPLLTMENRETRPRAASVDSPKNRKTAVTTFAKQKLEALSRLSQSDVLNSKTKLFVTKKHRCSLPDVKSLTPREYMRIRTLLKENPGV
ncbi:MAG: hypothetical protein WD055_05105 [Candidatus Dependentiae bacterium]